MRQLRIGDVTITGIIERAGPWRNPAAMSPAYEIGTRHLKTLDPAPNAGSGDLRSGHRHEYITDQTFVVRTPYHTILVGTCTGEDKAYPPPMDFSKQRYLDEFKAAGLSYDKNAFCTLHVDHCGWNTVPRDGRWVPTFPNVRLAFSPGPAGPDP